MCPFFTGHLLAQVDVPHGTLFPRKVSTDENHPPRRHPAGDSRRPNPLMVEEGVEGGARATCGRNEVWLRHSGGQARGYARAKQDLPKGLRREVKSRPSNEDERVERLHAPARGWKDLK